MLSDIAFDDDPIVDSDGSGVLPDIWIEGHGKLLNSSYPVSSAVRIISTENRHIGLRACEIKFRGYCFAENFCSSELMVARNRGLDLDPVFKLWTVLRDCYWPDSARRRP